MTSESYRLYRPKTLDTVIGQDHIVKQLTTMLDKGTLPHAILLSGPSGVGKTTVARILAERLGASSLDIKEINCAQDTGIDGVRDIQSRATMRSLGGGCRVYVLDESHKLSGPAQQSMLKLLEDCPEHVYFFLCTSEPEKLITAVRNRLTHLQFKALSRPAMDAVISGVLEKAGVTLELNTVSDIIDASDGSARKALVYLDQIIAAGEASADAILETPTEKREMVELVKAIYAKATMGRIEGMVKELPVEEIESFRHFVLSWGASQLKNAGTAESAAKIMTYFCKPFFETKRPGLMLACYLATKK